MMTDEQYIVYLFEKNFKRFKNRSIVLYGKGPMTKLLLKRFPDYNIVGIMDKTLKCGLIYDKPVLSSEDLLYRNIDLIIPVARPESMEKIFRRIYQVCVTNHIELYGLNGDNLFDTCDISEVQMIEPDFVEVFREKFRDCWNKKIVLYGKGPRTQRLIEACPEYQIIGILDKNEKEGMIYGKRILDYESAVDLGVDMIIAITRPEHLKYIYNRIHEFCSYHKIQLYDVEGNNLFITQKSTSFIIESHPYFEVGEEDLINQIDSHDVISFDMFDTLVMRKTLYPSDVFEIVEAKAAEEGFGIRNFKQFRREAEEETVHEVPNIRRIYERLQQLTGISDMRREQLMQLEIQIEKKVLIRREKMVSVMNYAVKKQKQVYIVSDMYLPAAVLTEILDRLEIVGYSKVFVSCEYHKNKVTGLYEIFKNHAKGKSYLHIGDNFHADGTYARQNGLDSFYIKKASEMLAISSYFSVQQYTTNINERLVVGLFVANAFNDPFCLYNTDGRISLNEVYHLGFLFIGPLISKFIIWLVEQMKVNNYDELLFSARDGYLIQKLYTKYKKEKNITTIPNGIYFQSSRHAAVCASMQTEEDIRWISSLPYFDTPELMIHQSFDLPMEDILSYNKEKYQDIVSYGLAHKEKIYKNSSKLAKNYLTYINNLGLKKNKRYALFDFVSSGTCQFSLNKIVPFSLIGVYMCNYDCQKPDWRALPSDAMYIQNRVVEDNTYGAYLPQSYFFRNYLFLETIITSLDSTLIGFTEQGEPIYGEETRSEEELQYVRDSQQGIEDFFAAYTELAISDIPIDIVLVDKIYSLKDLKYTNEHCEILNNFYLREDMIHGKLPLIRKV